MDYDQNLLFILFSEGCVQILRDEMFQKEWFHPIIFSRRSAQEASALLQ